jgi:predicted protein tyrosine phosphatase
MPAGESTHRPELLILSEEKARRYQPAGREVCISITNPKSPPPRLSKSFLATLRLEFTDIAKQSPFEWDRLFNEECARAIIVFVKQWADVHQIVIHCMAGQSRSPGIAMGLCELFSWDLGDLEERHPLWNTWVRSELVRVGREVMR